MLPLAPIGLACLLLAGPAAEAQSPPASIPVIAHSDGVSGDSPGSEPGRQTVPGPGDRGQGPWLPEGEEGGSNAAIGDALHSIYFWGSLAGLVIVLLIAVNK